MMQNHRYKFIIKENEYELSWHNFWNRIEIHISNNNKQIIEKEVYSHKEWENMNLTYHKQLKLDGEDVNIKLAYGLETSYNIIEHFSINEKTLSGVDYIELKERYRRHNNFWAKKEYWLLYKSADSIFGTIIIACKYAMTSIIERRELAITDYARECIIAFIVTFMIEIFTELVNKSRKKDGKYEVSFTKSIVELIKTDRK